MKNIMFIDDDELYLQVLIRVCKGIKDISTIFTKKDGAEALNFLESRLTNQEFLPHVLFVDIHMPTMDGFQFLTEFKKKRKKNQSLLDITPIVMLTSSCSQYDQDKVHHIGIVDRYIIKSGDIKTMRQIIKECIDV